MFGCQQVLIKFDSATTHIWAYLCSEANDLYNCTVYYARQIWFKAGKIVTGFDLTAEMKTNRHFNAGYASSMQQVCIGIGEAFKSFKKLLALYCAREIEQKPKRSREETTKTQRTQREGETDELNLSHHRQESQPKPPKYRKSGGMFTVTYPKCWLKLEPRGIRFPLGK
jgi:putative transposase